MPKKRAECGRSERRNLTQPPEYWAAFQAAADKAGQTLSEWVGDRCLDALPQSQRKKLPDRRDPGGAWRVGKTNAEIATDAAS